MNKEQNMDRTERERAARATPAEAEASLATQGGPRPIGTGEELEGRLADLVAATLGQEEAMLEMEGKIKAIRDRYEGEIAELGKQIGLIEALVRDWADRNPAAFNGKRSLELLQATIGYRLGKRRLELLGGHTEDQVLGRLTAQGSEFVRTKRTIDRSGLLMASTALGEAWMRKLGLRVVQDEEFFVAPKREARPCVAQGAMQGEQVSAAAPCEPR